MRKQELLDDEEREQRQKEKSQEGPDDMLGTPVDELGDSPLVELPESCSSHVELIETPQQVKPTPDIENDGNKFM